MKCRECERPMRPKGAKIADYPDTVQAHGRGVCTLCGQRRRGSFGARHEPLPPLPLSAGERAVLGMVERRCVGEERSRVAAMLGVSGRGA